MLHFLKIWPGPLRSIRAGTKQYEVRREDDGRRFQVGDVLVLAEYVDRPDPTDSSVPGYYTGQVTVARVTHLTRGGDPPAPLPVGVTHRG